MSSETQHDMLLERGDDLARLAAALEAIEATSEGRLVLVGGEAGVGKLDVTSRGEAAAKALRLGLTT